MKTGVFFAAGYAGFEPFGPPFGWPRSAAGCARAYAILFCGDLSEYVLHYFTFPKSKFSMPDFTFARN